jgi:hypothetical protein
VNVPPWTRPDVPWFGTLGDVPLPFGAPPFIEAAGITCAWALLLCPFVFAVGKLLFAIISLSAPSHPRLLNQVLHILV